MYPCQCVLDDNHLLARRTMRDKVAALKNPIVWLLRYEKMMRKNPALGFLGGNMFTTHGGPRYDYYEGFRNNANWGSRSGGSASAAYFNAANSGTAYQLPISDTDVSATNRPNVVTMIRGSNIALHTTNGSGLTYTVFRTLAVLGQTHSSTSNEVSVSMSVTNANGGLGINFATSGAITVFKNRGESTVRTQCGNISGTNSVNLDAIIQRLSATTSKVITSGISRTCSSSPPAYIGAVYANNGNGIRTELTKWEFSRAGLITE